MTPGAPSNRIALVACYLGPLPRYFRYFCDSAALNADVDFLVFSDQDPPTWLPGNVSLIPFSLQQFNELASAKLGMDIRITHPYKLCDFKPAYGVIFEDNLASHDFWGMCDLDVIWGRIRHFVTEEVLNNCDVIAAKHTHTPGHFTLFRNRGMARDLFRQTEDYRTVFADVQRTYCYDETCTRWNQFYKLADLQQKGTIASIFEIALAMQEAGHLRLCLEYWVREHPAVFDYDYGDGVFTDHTDKREFMYFHLVHVKSQERFHIPHMERLPRQFRVLPDGLVPSGLGFWCKHALWRVGRSSHGTSHVIRAVCKRISSLVGGKWVRSA